MQSVRVDFAVPIITLVPRCRLQKRHSFFLVLLQVQAGDACAPLKKNFSASAEETLTSV